MFQTLTVVHKFNFFNRILSSVLVSILPQQTKRRIYISSLIAVIEQITNPDAILAKKVNDLFALAHKDDRAIILPMVLHSMIWGNIIDVNKQTVCGISIKELRSQTNMSDEQLRRLAIRVYRLTPKWLVYSNKTEVVQELTSVFRKIPALRAA